MIPVQEQPVGSYGSKHPRRYTILPTVIERVLQYTLLAGIAMVSAVPFVWMVLSVFKPTSDLRFYPPRWLPTSWTLDNLITAWTAGRVERYVLNTAFVATVTLIFFLLTTMMAGYAFARLDFPLKGPLFALVLIVMMVPWPVTIIPSYILIAKFPLFGGNDLFGQGGKGMIDSYWSLILPAATGSFGIFLFRQFFRTLPKEMDDAARIDGASELTILWRIVAPLSGPAIATMTIFQFQAVWNNFLWPFLVINDSRKLMLQVGLYQMTNPYHQLPYVQMAGTLIATIPVVVIFFVGQKWFVRGIQLTGFV